MKTLQKNKKSWVRWRFGVAAVRGINRQAANLSKVIRGSPHWEGDI